MAIHPGKMLDFMGNEFAQLREFDVQLGVGAVQPPERLGVVLAAPERLVGKIRLIQRPAVAVEVVVVREGELKLTLAPFSGQLFKLV